MPGTKTSVWLSEEQVTQWKASGLSLTEIVRRGLAAGDPQEAATEGLVTAISSAVGTLIDASEERVRRIVREELERVASQ